jgi:hypothetical protein
MDENHFYTAGSTPWSKDYGYTETTSIRTQPQPTSGSQYQDHRARHTDGARPGRRVCSVLGSVSSVPGDNFRENYNPHQFPHGTIAVGECLQPCTPALKADA